jgi:hypothetical protein
MDEVFKSSCQEILAGFFEDRPDELADSLIEHWPMYEQQQAEKETEIEKMMVQQKLKSLALLAARYHDKLQTIWFYRLKNQILKIKFDALHARLREEIDRNDECEALKIQAQIELRELRDRLLEFESKVERQETKKIKKKQIQARRKKMKKQKDHSQSLSIEKSTRL